MQRPAEDSGASIEDLFDPIKNADLYLSDNGAYVGCHGRNLFLNTIDRGLVIQLIQEIHKRPELEVMVSGPGLCVYGHKR